MGLSVQQVVQTQMNQQKQRADSVFSIYNTVVIEAELREKCFVQKTIILDVCCHVPAGCSTHIFPPGVSLSAARQDFNAGGPAGHNSVLEVNHTG